MNRYFFMIMLAPIFLIAYKQIDAKNSITVIGVGRLGLCTALCFEKAGYHVLGVDLDQKYVDALNNKTFTTREPYVDELLRNSKNFKATCSLAAGLEFSDLYFILVDTPSTSGKEAYDHKNLNNVLADINKTKVCNKHIVISSTVFPGYIRTIGKALLKDCVNTTLSYNPEFIAQGNIIYGLQHPDIILIGQDSVEAGDALENVYRTICLNVPRICRMSTDSAEITKLAINCFITTKIAFANMVADIADETPGANKNEILQAVGGDHRIGDLCLKPGYGFGGPCFPRDNRALGNYAQLVDIEPCIPRATDTANESHAIYMTKKLIDEGRQTYFFEDVNYKENCPVPIIEESQKLVIAQGLASMGKTIIIQDKEPVINAVRKKFGDIFEYQIQP